MTLSIAPILLLIALGLGRQETATELYNRAVGHYNDGRIGAAAEVLRGLVDEHTDYFLAYRLHWDAVGKVEDEEAMFAAILESMDYLETVADEARTEDYYTTCLVAAERLEEEELHAALTEEVCERFPRGTHAQSAMLRRARAEEDPLRSAQLLQEYVDTFPENTSWVNGAIRDRFRVLVEHPDRFELAQIVEQANAFDRSLTAFVDTYGNPSRRVFGLVEVAHKMLEVDPDVSLDFIERAIAYTTAAAPETEEFDEQMVQRILPIRVIAAVELGQWEVGLNAGVKSIPDAATGRQPTLFYFSPFTEAELRIAYADCLAHSGREIEAGLQLAYAAQLDPVHAPASQAWAVANALDGSAREEFDRKVAAFEEIRRDQRRRALLGSEIHRSAPPFELEDLEGAAVSNETLRGKVIVLDFWATWCGPCINELEDLKVAYQRYREDPDVEFVAISVDTQKQLVAPFAEKKGYTFPVLFSDGTVEEPYGTSSIPQLYILDADGAIRFHQSGYHEEHFLERLDWMIEAARKPTGKRN